MSAAESSVVDVRSRMPRVRSSRPARKRATGSARSSRVTMATPLAISKLPAAGSTDAGAGMTCRTPGAAPASPQAARAARHAAAASVLSAIVVTVRTIEQGRRSCLLRPLQTPLAPSELDAEAQVVLRPVLVERPRLVFVEREVLVRRVVEVLAVQGDRVIFVERVPQRSRQGSDVVLRERGLPVEAAEEFRAVSVGDTRVEARVLEVGAQVVGVLGSAYQPVVVAGQLRGLLTVRVGVVGGKAEIVVDGLLIVELGALHASLRIDGDAQVVLDVRAVRIVGSVCKEGPALSAERDVVVEIHVEEADTQQRIAREIPLQPGVEVRRADGFEARIAA